MKEQSIDSTFHVMRRKCVEIGFYQRLKRLFRPFHIFLNIFVLFGPSLELKGGKIEEKQIFDVANR